MFILIYCYFYLEFFHYFFIEFSSFRTDLCARKLICHSGCLRAKDIKKHFKWSASAAGPYQCCVQCRTLDPESSLILKHFADMTSATNVFMDMCCLIYVSIPI